MLTRDALEYFGGVGAIKKAIESQGEQITRQAIYAWHKAVPMPRAFTLETASNGALKVDLEQYRP